MFVAESQFHDVGGGIHGMNVQSKANIRLDNFLKHSGLVGTGGEAKLVLQIECWKQS